MQLPHIPFPQLGKSALTQPAEQKTTRSSAPEAHIQQEQQKVKAMGAMKVLGSALANIPDS